MTENSDESLITAHLQGDPEAFTAIVCRYGDVLLPPLWEYSFIRCGMRPARDTDKVMHFTYAPALSCAKWVGIAKPFILLDWKK